MSTRARKSTRRSRTRKTATPKRRNTRTRTKRSATRSRRSRNTRTRGRRTRSRRSRTRNQRRHSRSRSRSYYSYLHAPIAPGLGLGGLGGLAGLSGDLHTALSPKAPTASPLVDLYKNASYPGLSGLFGGATGLPDLVKDPEALRKAVKEKLYLALYELHRQKPGDLQRRASFSEEYADKLADALKNGAPQFYQVLPFIEVDEVVDFLNDMHSHYRSGLGRYRERRTGRRLSERYPFWFY